MKVEFRDFFVSLVQVFRMLISNPYIDGILEVTILVYIQALNMVGAGS